MNKVRRIVTPKWSESYSIPDAIASVQPRKINRVPIEDRMAGWKKEFDKCEYLKACFAENVSGIFF